jgi:hypothetical protein
MPATKEQYSRCHQAYLDSGAEEPQWTLGEASTNDERYFWQRTMDFLDDVAPDYQWQQLNAQQRLRYAAAANLMSPGSKITLYAMDPAVKQARLNSGWVTRWHGTYPSALWSIKRYGLLPSYGAGDDHRRRDYGFAAPQVFVAKKGICAIDYPQLMWQGDRMVGEVVAADGAPPMRALIELIAPSWERSWRKEDGDRTQESYGFGVLEVVSIELHAVALCPEGQERRSQNCKTMKEIFLDPHGANAVSGQRADSSARTGEPSSSARTGESSSSHSWWTATSWSSASWWSADDDWWQSEPEWKRIRNLRRDTGVKQDKEWGRLTRNAFKLVEASTLVEVHLGQPIKQNPDFPRPCRPRGRNLTMLADIHQQVRKAAEIAGKDGQGESSSDDDNMEQPSAPSGSNATPSARTGGTSSQSARTGDTSTPATGGEDAGARRVSFPVMKATDGLQLNWRPTNARQWKDETPVDLKAMPEDLYPILHRFLRSKGGFESNQPLPRFPCQLRQLPWDLWVGVILKEGLEAVNVSTQLVQDGRSWIRPFLDRMAEVAGGQKGQGANPVYLNRMITRLLASDPEYKQRFLEERNSNLSEESRLGAWLMDTTHTAIMSLVMPSSVKQKAEFKVVSNAVYRQMYSAEPLLKEEYKTVYIGDLYEAVGWVLMELNRMDVLLWHALLCVLETATYNELNECVPKRASDEHQTLLRLVYPDGLYHGAQWIDQLRA